jgi:hypothetical protein
MRYVSKLMRSDPGTVFVTLLMIGLLSFGVWELLSKVKIR